MMMRILVLYGPNLNLLGLVSAHTGTRLTLDKLNRVLRRRAGKLDVELKFFQTQSESDASKIIQRQRNNVEGLLLIPGRWAQTGHLLRETVEITRLPLAVFHLEPEPGPWHSAKESLFLDVAVHEAKGATPEEVTAFLERFVAHLRP
ncbi:MAG: type II 3-dehydroquinate dehydratase [Candidatus Neomarinimicrobiota bacterium]